MTIQTDSNRRDHDRVPLSFFLNEYVDERLHRVVTTNLSSTGLYVHRAWSTARRLPFGREDRFVQLEFALPGSSDTIWALGEVRYDELAFDDGASATSPLVHGTGIEFRQMARGHARLLRDYVEDFALERRKQQVRAIHALTRLQASRLH